MAEYFNSGTKFVKKGDVVFEPDQRRKEMKTRFITGGRGTGKTTKLIREAVENTWKSIIVTSTGHGVLYIKDMLHKMYGNRYVVPVVTFKDLLTHSRELDGLFTNNPKLYFDDLIPCLDVAIDTAYYPCDIAAAVIDTEDEISAAIDQYCINDAKVTFDLYTTQIKAEPHIDHVIFNGPATIVFWKDGTKTVVKHDGKGRKDKRTAIMYAFMRKIYGEGRSYHNILSEIEEALKCDYGIRS